MANPIIALLVHQLDLAFDRRSWHGTNLMGSVRGLDAPARTWRPQRGRHNIAELIVHAAYWKYRVCRLVTDVTPRSFDWPGSDFFDRSKISDLAWKSDLHLIRVWHKRLRESVMALPAGKLSATAKGTPFTITELVTGAAAHDLYHAGQIQLIKRLYNNR